jgi:hypothetical protein
MQKTTRGGQHNEIVDPLVQCDLAAASGLFALAHLSVVCHRKRGRVLYFNIGAVGTFPDDIDPESCRRSRLLGRLTPTAIVPALTKTRWLIHSKKM